VRPLVVPPAALRDENSIQMLSAWIAERGLHCTLNIGFFEQQGHKEPKAWGMLLADVVKHIANACKEVSGVSTPETVQRILDSMNEELEDSTSAAEGKFVERPS